ncbi:hypothetical protein [Nocardiopsis ansamitocini]|uniref:DUF333 domain-containing protein n=1 Tax=Nocardiopsis ansamitocini TaxID=1670832 RepID=A0A9W6P6Y5_9ACTN|nr:hypothetical protein [Nocardiopsis ansamitocini]GLU48178.1 hypothetical protein Nans01_25290 [Nocardiopsis ansamitocini]
MRYLSRFLPLAVAVGFAVPFAAAPAAASAAAQQGPIVAAPREKVIGYYPTQRACNESGRRLGGEAYRCARNQYGEWMLIVWRA